MKRNATLSFLLSILSFGIALGATDAEAAIAYQPCYHAGETTVSEDQHSMVACLYDSSEKLVWKSITQPDSSAGENKTNVVATAAPVPVQEYGAHPSASHWQGWYAGIAAGASDTDSEFQGSGSGSTYDLDSFDGTVGIVGGYNIVKDNGLFYGAEADIDYAGNSQTRNLGSDSNLKADMDGFATLRGRVGAAFDPALVYVTGGLALVESTHTSNNTYTNQVFVPGYGFVTTYTPYGFSSTTIHPGGVIGAGTEFMVADKISMSLEYLRLEVPEYSKSYTAPLGGQTKYLIDDSADIVRVGLKWHFD